VGLAVVIAKLRYLFMALALISLGFSFYVAWWRRPSRRNKLTFAFTAMLVLGAVSYHFFQLWSPSPRPASQVEEALRRRTDLKAVSYHVEGMTCPGCAERIRSALKAIPGIEEVSIQFSSSEAILYQRAAAPVREKSIQSAFEKQGFRARRLGMKK